MVGTARWRVRTVAVASAVTVLALSACAPDAVEQKRTAVAHAAASYVRAPEVTAEDPRFAGARLSGPGVARYGAAAVQAALRDAAMFTLNDVVDTPLTLQRQWPDASALQGMRAHLTPEAWTEVNRMVEQSDRGLLALVPFDVLGDGALTPRTGGAPFVMSKTFSPEVATDLRRGGLGLQFTTEVEYRAVRQPGDEPVILTYSDDRTYVMVRDGQHWLVGGWEVRPGTPSVTRDTSVDFNGSGH